MGLMHLLLYVTTLVGPPAIGDSNCIKLHTSGPIDLLVAATAAKGLRTVFPRPNPQWGTWASFLLKSMGLVL